MHVKLPTRFQRFAWLVLLVLLAFSPASALGQGAAANEAIIIVQPLGPQTAISVTYSKPHAHPAVRATLESLARAGGWKLSGVTVKDEEMVTGAQFGTPESLGRQTGAECLATGPNIVREGGFVLQPFIETFKSLDQFDILFFTQASPDFHGLRDFDADGISIHLIQATGPYRYRVNIRDHAAKIPTLPLTQAVPAVGNTTAAPTTAPASAGIHYGPVLIIAACSGLAVLLGLRLLSTRKPASRKDDRHRRTSHTQTFRPGDYGGGSATRRKD